MPPKAKRSYKPRKSAPKAKKAYKPKAKGGRKPMARRAVGDVSKTTIRQQNLGQQTDSKVTHRMGRPDSRSFVLKQVSPACHYIHTDRGTITTNGYTGRQAWSYAMLADTADLNEIGTQLNINTFGAGSAPGGVNLLKPPSSYLLTKLQHKMKFSNVGQATCRLSIIHLRAKRDLYNTMSYTDPNSNTYVWSSPVDAVQQGVASAVGGVISGDVNFLIPGVDETESPIFNKYFSKVKTTEVFLAVGGTHSLTTDVYYDRVLDASVYGNGSLNGVLGVTEFLLFKCEGQTGIDLVTANPQIAQCQVAFTQNWDYSFVQVQNARRWVAVQDAIESNAHNVNIISASTGTGLPAQGLIP